MKRGVHERFKERKKDKKFHLEKSQSDEIRRGLKIREPSDSHPSPEPSGGSLLI